MANLKKYDQPITKDYLPSGVESPKSKGKEMQIVVPFEIKENGKYRAICPDTGWRGWVEYTPETVAPPDPDPQALKIIEFNSLRMELVDAKKDLELGLIDEIEYNNKLNELKKLKDEL